VRDGGTARSFNSLDVSTLAAPGGSSKQPASPYWRTSSGKITSTITMVTGQEFVLGGYTSDGSGNKKHLARYDFAQSGTTLDEQWIVRLGSEDYTPLADATGVVDSCLTANSGFLVACLFNRAIR
jgi:hypothetical protein